MKNILILVCVFLIKPSWSQTPTLNKIYKDDTCFLKKRNIKTQYYYDFKDSLQDGKWILYNVLKNDSLKKKKIILSCDYKNNVRNGIYEINRYNLRSDENLLVEKITSSYKNGYLHGSVDDYYYSNILEMQILLSHEEYYYGKKNGVFLQNGTDGKLVDIIVYCNDSVKQINNYIDVDGISIKCSEIIVLSNNNIKFIRYFSDSDISKVELLIKKGVLINFKSFDYLNNIIEDQSTSIDIGFANPLDVPNKILWAYHPFKRFKSFKNYLESK